MRRLHCIALIPLVACISPPDAPPDLEPIEKVCVKCGPNGAMVGGHPFSWILLGGTENDGVTFLEFRKNGKARPLDVDKNVLRYFGQDGQWHGYKDLENTVISVAIGSDKYDVTIDEVHNCRGTSCTDHGIPYWTQVPSGEAETYRLHWVKLNPKPDDPPEQLKGEVCPYDDVEELTGGHLKEALVFEGDHYDPITRDITATDTKTTFKTPFNIACMGSLPAKMELSRRTDATQDAKYNTTIEDDRQALARAWGAQYCKREVFTETGHRIRIKDKRGWLSRTGWGWSFFAPAINPKFTYEAVWDSSGAVCVEKPRLEVPDPKGPAEEDGAIWQRMEEKCGQENVPPRCSDQPWFPSKWQEHGQFLTANIAWEEPGSIAVPPPPPSLTLH